jgi:hypothetical protein
VLDQKYPVIAIEHHGADAERHAAGKSPLEMKNPSQQRLECGSKALPVHRHRDLEFPGISFDPCVAVTSWPILCRILTGNHDMIARPLHLASIPTGCF